jgi:hypothetical protein
LPSAVPTTPFERQAERETQRAETRAQAESRGRRQQEQAPEATRKDLQQLDKSYWISTALLDRQQYIEKTYGGTLSTGLSVRKWLDKMAGVNDPRLTEYTALIGELFNIDKKTLGGVTVPPHERADIVAAIPDTNENVVAAFRKIKLMNAKTEGILLRELKTMKHLYPLEDISTYFVSQIRERKKAARPGQPLVPELAPPSAKGGGPAAAPMTEPQKGWSIRPIP